MTKEYVFDIKYWATAYVKADTEEEARKVLEDYQVIDTPAGTGMPNIDITCQTSEGDADLIEIDGRMV